MNTERFYALIQPFSDFSDFADAGHYQPLPDNWSVVITDVTGSTQAIQAGHYKQVNGVGVASIVALTNALKPMEIPYVFGGDGVTALVPDTMLPRVRPALFAVRKMALEQFGMRLRLGVVGMADIRQHGCHILVGKYSPHAYFRQTMIQGDGLIHAEKLIKQEGADNPYILRIDAEEMAADQAAFNGFECRWNKIPSPHGENVALMVQAMGVSVAENNQIYGRVADKIRHIYGDDAQHHPLVDSSLSLTASSHLLSVEARVRTAFASKWAFVKYLLQLYGYCCAGILLMARGIKKDGTDWGAYKKNLVANTDYRKFDQVLRMIISGTRQQNARLRSALEQCRDSGELVFGMHTDPAALITCMITDYDKDHIHFMDVANGGYAAASQEMKKQLGKNACFVPKTGVIPDVD